MVAQADLPATTAAASHTWAAPSRTGDEAPSCDPVPEAKGKWDGQHDSGRGERPSPWPALKSPAHPLLRGIPPQRPHTGASYILVSTNAPFANQCRNDGRHRPPEFGLTHSTLAPLMAASVSAGELVPTNPADNPLSRSSLSVGQFGAVARMSTAAPFPRRSSSRPLA